MTSGNDIKPRIINSYLTEAFDITRSGHEIKPARRESIYLHPLLKEAITSDAKGKAGFDKLTPGARRLYAEYITEAKQDATKRRRLEKILPMIKRGEGLNEKYKPK